jgi:hypothetical protein
VKAIVERSDFVGSFGAFCEFQEKIKNFIGKIKKTVHICRAMKVQIVNKHWWWHTNLDRGL